LTISLATKPKDSPLPEIPLLDMISNLVIKMKFRVSLKQSHGFDLTRSFYEELCRKETNKIVKNNKLQPVFGRQNSEFIISSLARGIDIRVVIYSVRGLAMGLFSSKEFCQISQVETDISAAVNHNTFYSSC
jgi:hypothetical protein